MRGLFFLTSLLALACGTAEAPCPSCSETQQHAEQAEPAMSSGELEKELDEIERQIEADGGRQ